MELTYPDLIIPSFFIGHDGPRRRKTGASVVSEHAYFLCILQAGVTSLQDSTIVFGCCFTPPDWAKQTAAISSAKRGSLFDLPQSIKDSIKTFCDVSSAGPTLRTAFLQKYTHSHNRVGGAEECFDRYAIQ